MITIIHGDDIISSRKYLMEEKKRQTSPTTLDGENLNLTELTQLFKSDSLFSTEKYIFIENFFKRKKSKELEEIVSYININSTNINVFLWEGSELSKSELSMFPKARVQLFQIQKNLFTFLDGISPKNINNVRNFHLALKTADEDAIFYMIVRQFRLLLSVCDDSSRSIDEMKRLAPWQKNKLQRQSKLFTKEELKRVYDKLYEVDLSIKTGTYSNLINAIDFLLLDI